MAKKKKKAKKKILFDPEDLSLEALDKVDRDVLMAIKAGKVQLGDADIRYFVDVYYQIQEFRKAASNQESASVDFKEPTNLVEWYVTQFFGLEKQMKRVLNAWTETRGVCRWAKSIYGIGPILSAGLSAHINIAQCPTTGHIWRFAGLDPGLEWLGQEKAKALVKQVMDGQKKVTDDHLEEIGELLTRKPERIEKLAKIKTGKLTRLSLEKALARRPWNHRLKVLCWKIGDSFCKFHNRPKCSYGHLYAARKKWEVRKNKKKDYHEQAERALRERRIQDKDLKACYESGMLPDGRIELRARRYAVKIFLSHWHHIAYKAHFGQDPPKPYVIAHLGHGHMLRPQDMT
jgi:hypothetical protein